MPAAKLYIGSSEIAALMGISIREAQYKLRMFEGMGQTISFGKIKKLSLRNFARYISQQDGSDPEETFRTMKQAIMESQS